MVCLDLFSPFSDIWICRKLCKYVFYLEKRSCQLFYYCVHMAEKTTSLCYVSFYVKVLGISLRLRKSLRNVLIYQRVVAVCCARARQTLCSVHMHAVRGSVFGCACARNFLLWNCFLHELFRIFRLMAWLISFRRC